MANSTFNLSDLDGSNGFRLNGINNYDNSGISVSNGGDINGDGIDDLIIGAYGADPNGSNSGQSYVVFGAVGIGAGGVLELANLVGSTGDGIDFATEFTGTSIPIVDSDLTLVDANSGNMAGATVTITNLQDGASESLSADTTGTPITANYDDTNGVLTLSGTGTIAEYQQVLRTITYNNVNSNFDTTARIIEFVADDGGAHSNTSAIATTTLTMTLLNQAPTLDNEISNQNTFEQITFDFAVPANTFSDPDGDTLSYTATLPDNSALPSWLDFDPNSQTFSGKPANSDVGTILVKVTATDTGSLSVSDTFELVVDPLEIVVTNSTGGNDTLDGGIGFNLIDGGGGNDSITGNVVGDSLKGGSGNDTLKGLDEDDLLDGGSGNDLMEGGNGNDIIKGGSGNDTLTGGMGDDTLTGGSGADAFLFNFSNEGVDSITDFKVTDDKIWVNSSGFDNLPLGVLDVNAFVRGSSATTGDHRFIYNPSDGLLSFDADGNGGGGSIELASLRSGLAMTNANIMVFGNVA